MLGGEEETASLLREPRLERAIGVIYLPRSERASHYFHAQLTEQFDVMSHFDETRAVEPLERTATWEAGEVPETYPSNAVEVNTRAARSRAARQKLYLRRAMTPKASHALSIVTAMPVSPAMTFFHGPERISRPVGLVQEITTTRLAEVVGQQKKLDPHLLSLAPVLAKNKNLPDVKHCVSEWVNAKVLMPYPLVPMRTSGPHS